LGRIAYDFVSSVIFVCTSPYPYLHLSYPKDIRHVEVRHSQRIALSIPATVRRDQAVVIEAEIRDLSAGVP
jgi:hypothetical protein